MASFIAKLFGGGKKKSTPTPAPVPEKTPTPISASDRRGKARRSKTQYTGALGLSEKQRSGQVLKTLTGQ